MKVSIITPTYNSGNTLAGTLESVLSQTHQDLDYWVVDGGSTDNTLSIVREAEARFNGRLHLISEPDNGIYDAMNKGILHCTGDIVGILNSDDFFSAPDIVERIVKAFQDSPQTEAVYGDVHLVAQGREDRCVRYFSGRIFSPSLVRWGIVPPHPSFYVRREVLMRHELYDTQYKISADFELMARLCVRCHILTKYLPLDFVTMRTGGTSTRNWAAHWQGTLEDYRACRKLHIFTCKLMICMKFPMKWISGLLFSRR